MKKKILAFTILFSVSALGATFSGQVVDVTKDSVIMKNGKQIMQFNVCEKGLKLPHEVEKGQNITVTYSAEEHALMSQQAGQVAPDKGKVIKDDRIFYGA